MQKLEEVVNINDTIKTVKSGVSEGLVRSPLVIQNQQTEDRLSVHEHQHDQILELNQKLERLSQGSHHEEHHEVIVTNGIVGLHRESEHVSEHVHEAPIANGQEGETVVTVSCYSSKNSQKLVFLVVLSFFGTGGVGTLHPKKKKDFYVTECQEFWQY